MSLLDIRGAMRGPGRRRVADVRSLGYSELFVLSKDDLWDVLEEFPKAKVKMMEVGKERLRQDGLLVEEVSLCFCIGIETGLKSITRACSMVASVRL